eukprot:TRINITY_DN13683_c0_g1_i1.p1 TRINITY_DN13683_c0_g1~~TRINITY_DN13683_c0_g1_i1.p1  ORF type:complete len:412 (+),score=131.31 TRINITY_DN13683_c0_g1_i1:63-1298(+)
MADEADRLRGLLLLARGSYTREVIQPHAASAPVVVVTPNDGAPAVVKIRGVRRDGACREEAFYQLSVRLGLGGVVAPCAWGKITQPKAKDAPVVTLEDDVAKLLAEHYEGEDDHPPPYSYCTVEAFVAAPTGSPFRNEKGLCDTALAYLSTVDGRYYEDSSDYMLCSQGGAAIPDQAFADLAHDVAQVPLAKLILMCIVGCQRDGGGPNLALTDVPEAPGTVQLMSIDNTCTLQDVPEDKLRLTMKDRDSRHAVYWYPAALAFPGALQPLPEELRALVALWSPDDVKGFLAPRTLLGGEPLAESASRAGARVERLQQLLKTDPSMPLRDLAFAVVPSFERDFDAAVEEGDMGPLPMLQADAAAGLPRTAWAHAAWKQRAAYRAMVAAGCGCGAVAVGVVAVWAVRWWRREQ